ncbi:MAG: restriction endonuclease [Bacteroidales bacterium]
MNNGKKLEKFVRIIQEAFKDIPNTEIFTNYKIKNTSGRKREIDVLIKSMVNNFEIIIVIECKDYKTAVPVEKIEAFNSKCKRIKDISKKIFVSSNGYQADAIEAAKDFGIDLYFLDKIKIQDVIQWIPIKQLKAKYLLKTPHSIMFNAKQSEIEKIPSDEELIIHYYDDKEPISLNGLLWNTAVFENQKQLKTILLYDFMENGNNLNYQTIIPYKMDFSGIYINGQNESKIDILSVESAIIGWLEETPANIIEARSYKKTKSETIANIVSIDIDKNEVADIVFTNKNNINIFHTDSNGQVRQMVTLFEYNPKTEKLILK